MKPKQRAETPPMTAKDIRQLLVSKPTDKTELLQIADDLKVWYYANLHLITVGEDVAFKRYIGKLIEHVGGLK